MKRVAIIHPWYPQYRQPFFDRLVEICRESDIELSIFHGDPPPEWRERGDAVEDRFAVRLPTRFVRFRGRSLGLKALAAFHRKGPFDLVVLEQAIRNVESYRLLVSPRYHRKLAFWGHGRTYTENRSGLEENLKYWLTSRGRWFFAYTSGGSRAVSSRGFPEAKITTVNNSIDTNALRLAISKITCNEVNAFSAQFSLAGKTALYIGGLDPSKRIDFLLEAGRRAHHEDPDFRLLIAGDGTLRKQVESFAATEGWCHALGSLFGSQKALAMRAAQALAIPGRVGLVAVDSFASGLPIVTTDWPFHAPEFDYLEHASTALVTINSVDDYSRGLLDILSDSDLRGAMSVECMAKADSYSIDAMARRFHDGLRGALGVCVNG
ncbi:MAG: glycosyltransferase family 4 protein [Microbacterium chocolatum]|nr:glycosyltransferase family 4 protein [Microbacterium chocolatum]